MRTVLDAIEQILSEWCACSMGLGFAVTPAKFDEQEVSRQLSDELNDPTSLSLRNPHWGEWNNRQSEYFLQCWQLVQGITLKDLVSFGGVQFKTHLANLLHSYHQLRDETTPRRLQSGKFNVVPEDKNSWRLGTYSKLDPLIVPSALLVALPFFDLRDLDDVLAEIELETGIVVEHELVRKLLDFGVLIESDPAIRSAHTDQSKSEV